MITYLPSFVSFVRMMTSNDNNPSRLRLYQTYKIFTLIIGTSLMVIFGIYLVMRWDNFVEYFCKTSVKSESEYDLYIGLNDCY